MREERPCRPRACELPSNRIIGWIPFRGNPSRVHARLRVQRHTPEGSARGAIVPVNGRAGTVVFSRTPAPSIEQKASTRIGELTISSGKTPPSGLSTHHGPLALVELSLMILILFPGVMIIRLDLKQTARGRSADPAPPKLPACHGEVSPLQGCQPP